MGLQIVQFVQSLDFYKSNVIAVKDKLVKNGRLFFFVFFFWMYSTVFFSPLEIFTL